MNFSKLHGLGNDFVVVDRREEKTPVPPALTVAICERNRGVGADGVLSVLPSELASFAMHVGNADGSVAQMCGNGLRCVVRWAVKRGVLPPSGGLVETGAGVLDCKVMPDGGIRVSMGPAILEAERIPVLAQGERVLNAELEVGGRKLAFTAVSMGNPHAIIFIDGDEDLQSLARQLGPSIEHHPLFPERTNVEFARLHGPRQIELVVWERGSGLTQACGTGACATAVAAILLEKIHGNAPVQVTLPGGKLQIEVASDFSQVWMTGPAVEVFEGRYLGEQ